MRCKTCDYRLWNLTSRQCPECGTPFRPSDFEFIPNTVQFCCPHCNQTYYGTDEQGHLVPPEFDCVSCSMHVHMDDMILCPALGREEDETERERLPWLDRAKRGGLRAWLSTVTLALTSPGRLMRLTPLNSSTGAAVWFAIVTHLLVLVAVAIPVLLFTALMVGRLSGGAGPGFLSFFGAGLGTVSCGGMLGVLLGIAVEGAAAHGLLRLTGKTAGGVGRTYQAICYSSGANAISAIPCLGWYLGWLWWPVSAVLALKEAQGVHGGRAALAVLTCPVLLFFGFIAFEVWAVSTALSTGGLRSLGYPGGGAPNETQIVLDAVLKYARAHSGRPPEHAIQLVADDYLMSLDLVSGSTATGEADVPVGTTNLERFDALAPARRDQIVQAVIQALPNATVAHRLGDFIFTYHGMDLDTVAPGLWVVVFWPDPDVQQSSAPFFQAGTFPVGLADGSMLTPPTNALARQLNAQNTLRARQGLAPLPSPATVTHAKPATGSPGIPAPTSAEAPPEGA